MIVPAEFDEIYGRYLDTSHIKRKQLDISYADDEECRFDIYYPEDQAGPCPVIVFFHGGAYFKGNKGRYQLKPALNGITCGYAVISVNYRLVPDHPLPDAFEDAVRAVKFIKSHACKLKINPDMIVLWGESSGGTLALATGFENPQGIRGIIDWYAPMRITDINMDEVVGASVKDLNRFMYGDARRARFVQERIDPLKYVKKGIPPVMIEHGTSDSIVDYHVSERLYKKLSEYLSEEKRPFYLISGAGHGVSDFEKADNLTRVFDFIDRVCTDEECAAAM